MPAVELLDVTKRLRGRLILDAISLAVPTGACVALVGPNGSGKTMLLRVIAGLVRPDAGTVRVFGNTLGSAIEFAPETGILIDRPALLPHLNGWQNLWLLACVNRVTSREEARELLRRVGLDPDDRRPVRNWSLGMRQRLGIAEALLDRPRLLLLDEPTNALDERGREQVLSVLAERKREGVTMVLTTHDERMVSWLADGVVRLEAGRIVECSWK